MKMAEGGGFEPPVRINVHGLATRCITTLPSLQRDDVHRGFYLAVTSLAVNAPHHHLDLAFPFDCSG